MRRAKEQAAARAKAIVEERERAQREVRGNRDRKKESWSVADYDCGFWISLDSGYDLSPSHMRDKELGSQVLMNELGIVDRWGWEWIGVRFRVSADSSCEVKVQQSSQRSIKHHQYTTWRVRRVFGSKATSASPCRKLPKETISRTWHRPCPIDWSTLAVLQAEMAADRAAAEEAARLVSLLLAKASRLPAEPPSSSSDGITVMVGAVVGGWELRKGTE